METLRIPDHIANRTSPGISQKHSVLGHMAEGGCNLCIAPERDVVYDICAVILRYIDRTGNTIDFHIGIDRRIKLRYL